MNLDDQILNVLRRLESLQDRTTQIGVELLHLRNAVSRLHADSRPKQLAADHTVIYTGTETRGQG